MKERNATLFVDQKRTWHVKLKPANSRQFTITGGWKKFFGDNKLKFGDVCVFELIKRKEVSFRVHIHRFREESSTPRFEGNLYTYHNFLLNFFSLYKRSDILFCMNFNKKFIISCMNFNILNFNNFNKKLFPLYEKNSFTEFFFHLVDRGSEWIPKCASNFMFGSY